MRAFLAITPDRETRDAIGKIQRRCREAVAHAAPHARVNWMHAEAVHLTLRFFAHIDESTASALHEHVARAIPASRAVTVPLARIGGFPRAAAPRVIWIGPPEDWVQSPEGARLAHIAEAIDQACDEVGLPREERRWRPHLTLARVKDGERRVGNGLREIENPPGGLSPPLRADHITLYRSDLTPYGSVHTRVWTVPIPQ